MKELELRNIRFCIKDELYCALNPFSTKWHPTWYKILNENSHIFYPLHDSQYRRAINYIANYIMNTNNKEYDVKLFKKKSELYEKYFLLMPFSGVPIINIINTLKIYVHYHEDNYIDAYNIADAKIKTDEYNQKELPLFKVYKSTISLVSIILNIPFNIAKNEIIDILAHELIHILNYVRSAKLGGNTTKWENARDKLILLLKLYNNRNVFNVCGYAANCCYYLQNTEINAHIENIISEFKINKFDRDTALLLCKYPNTILLQNINIDNYDILEEYLLSDNSYTMYAKLYKRTLRYKNNITLETDYMKEIACTIYPNSDTISFKKLIEYWYNQLQKFFKNLSSAIYNTY